VSTGLLQAERALRINIKAFYLAATLQEEERGWSILLWGHVVLAPVAAAKVADLDRIVLGSRILSSLRNVSSPSCLKQWWEQETKSSLRLFQVLLVLVLQHQHHRRFWWLFGALLFAWTARVRARVLPMWWENHDYYWD
jgi:hypothetical protein